jgi:hypothetical protein
MYMHWVAQAADLAADLVELKLETITALDAIGMTPTFLYRPEDFQVAAV